MEPGGMDQSQSPGSSSQGEMSHRVKPGSSSCTIQANPEQVREGLETITSGLPEPSDVDDPRARLEIVLAEVLNNIVEHAYENSGNGEICIEVAWDDAGIHCSTQDQGLAMPGLSLPENSLPDSDVPTMDLPEGGFGWFMIHSLTQDLVYARAEDTNKLSFRVDWDADLNT